MAKITKHTFKTDAAALEIIEREVLSELDQGYTRISIKKHIENTRSRFGLSVNNTDAPFIASYLIDLYPALSDVIETRTRGTVPLPAGTHPDIKTIYNTFRAIDNPAALTIKSIVLESEDGETVSMSLNQLRQLFKGQK